jgi:DNA polymerase III epsilon subunit-like protein
MNIFNEDTVVLVDTETTDIYEEAAKGSFPRILQIGAIKVRSKTMEVLDTLERYVKPDDLSGITHFTEQLNGITAETVESAEPWKNVVPLLYKLSDYGKIRLVGWNVSFDISCMSNECLRIREPFIFKRPPIDAAGVFYHTAASRGWQIHSYSLETACKTFGIEPEKVHTALNGVLKMRAVLMALQAIG